MLATVPVHALQRPSLAAPSLATAATPLVFRGVTVIDVQQGRPLPNRTVVIVGNRIQMVDKVDAVELPKGARVVEARGKYLIPGLWDMHVHQEHSVDLFDPLYLANGVTGIRDAGSPMPLDTLRRWRREILLAPASARPARSSLGSRSTRYRATSPQKVPESVSIPGIRPLCGGWSIPSQQRGPT